MNSLLRIFVALLAITTAFGQTVPKFPVRSRESLRLPDKLSLGEAKAAIDALSKDRAVPRQAETIPRIRDVVARQDLPALVAYCDGLTDRQLKSTLVSALLARW